MSQEPKKDWEAMSARDYWKWMGRFALIIGAGVLGVWLSGVVFSRGSLATVGFYFRRYRHDLAIVILLTIIFVPSIWFLLRPWWGTKR